MTKEDRLSPTAVIKLGGSLLGLPDLSARLSNFLGDFSRPRPVLICGGSETVDSLRRWDRTYNLGEERCHWLALRMLSITSRVLEGVCEDFVVVSSPDDFGTVWSEGRVPVYDSYDFIVDIDEESPDPLPRRWRVTSDSIAARVATHFGVDELVLLKAVDFPERISMSEAANSGLVDPHFPTAARDIERVVAVNLRLDVPQESFLYTDTEPIA